MFPTYTPPRTHRGDPRERRSNTRKNRADRDPARWAHFPRVTKVLRGGYDHDVGVRRSVCRGVRAFNALTTRSSAYLNRK